MYAYSPAGLMLKYDVRICLIGLNRTYKQGKECLHKQRPYSGASLTSIKKPRYSQKRKQGIVTKLWLAVSMCLSKLGALLSLENYLRCLKFEPMRVD